MATNKLKKESWTLNVDRRIKGAVIKEAKRRGVYPVQLIESMRSKDHHATDKKFLEEIRRWEKINS
ncbi:MAG: hypothetical protein HW419_2637 [Deltaproteobacteria bacterium]|nr:hypothetical protein [Deltaproteobacteria bacterium]